LTDNSQADCNTDSPTNNNDSSSPLRESSDNQSKHKAALGRTSAKKSREPSWENLTRTQPNRTTHFKPQGQHNGGPKQTQSTPGKNLRQKQQRAILGRTFTRMHNPTTKQHGPSEKILQPTELQKQHKLHDRNEHGVVLRETLTRTTTNGSGKPHQNTGQPSDAPQPRGQRNSNQKRTQHSSGETSLPPEPTEKNSRSTSPELTTSQRQADNNNRQVSQRSTSDATRHTGHLLSPCNNVD
ncbi:hypothetical protein Taro_038991, partial [Colocasia esculenta]|nr:hypothetical protein [Colocasia esculenta]